MKRIVAILTLISLVFLIGCNKNVKTEAGNDNIVVYTSFYPLYYLTDEIGKDKINLKTIVPNGVEPHDYEITMKQIEEINNSDLFIFNGAGMEDWLDKLLETINKDKIALINGSEEVDLITEKNTPDPHIWLDPINMDKIGNKIKDVLIELDEENKKFYEENYLNLSEKLKNLDKEYIEGLKNKKGDTILVSHKAFSYLANRYGLEQISVTGISPSEEPSPKAISNLIEIAKEKELDYIFLETLASPKTVDIIAKEANLEILVLNPLEGLTEKEEKEGMDYVSIMEDNLVSLKKALVE